MYDIFKILNQSIEASSRALDQSGKIPYPVLSLVSSINPGARTIRVVDSTNPLLESPDLRRIRSRANEDTYFPEIGSTVVAWYVEGTFDNGWWLPVENATNPPGEKTDPLKDHLENFPGNVTITVTKTLTIKTPGGASLILHENGDIEISNIGSRIFMQEGNGIQFTSDEIVRINGSGIMVEGGTDSDGDVMQSTGQ